MICYKIKIYQIFNTCVIKQYFLVSKSYNQINLSVYHIKLFFVLLPKSQRLLVLIKSKVISIEWKTLHSGNIKIYVAGNYVVYFQIWKYTIFRKSVCFTNNNFTYFKVLQSNQKFAKYST